MTRRNTLSAILAVPLAAVAKLAAQPKQPTGDVIRQSELLDLLRLQQRLERGAADIRRRAEAGAKLEHGKLGISTLTYEPLAQYEQWGEIGEDVHSIQDVAGLDIRTVDDIQGDIDLAQSHPNYEWKGLSLV